MKDKKKVIIFALCFLIAIFAIGYSLLAQELKINGTASIDSKWDIQITNIVEKSKTGSAFTEDKSYNATTANFSVGFIHTGDSITYEIEITNLGTLNGVIDSINVNTGDNSVISYQTSGITQGQYLLKRNKHYLTVTVRYDATKQPVNRVNTINVSVNYVQDTRFVGSNTDYIIGDIVQLADSNWIVIENSTKDKDYVVAIKEDVLSPDELGEYAYIQTHTCNNSDVNNNSVYYGVVCTQSGQVINGDATNTSIFSNSSSDYATSRIKEFLENTYLNTLGASNLKEVNGYKIRLVTLNELTSNLGYYYVYSCGDHYYGQKDLTPIWMYDVESYWTMNNNYSSVWYVNRGNSALSYASYSSMYSIRPVINIYKSSIE